EWRVTGVADCVLNVRLTQKNFHTDIVLAQRNGLATSGMITDTPQVDSNYFLDAWCEGGAVTRQRISVGILNPPPNVRYFCFKVVFPVSGICSTMAYPAESESEAEQRARAENPTATITSIDCSEMTTACGG